MSQSLNVIIVEKTGVLKMLEIKEFKDYYIIHQFFGYKFEGTIADEANINSKTKIEICQNIFIFAKRVKSCEW